MFDLGTSNGEMPDKQSTDLPLLCTKLTLTGKGSSFGAVYLAHLPLHDWKVETNFIVRYRGGSAGLEGGK